MLNLISNGFYAASKRKAEPNGGNYEPNWLQRPRTSVTASNPDSRQRHRHSTRGEGKAVQPVLYDKACGEQTGIGLSISHDIIVKQHGGSIEVDTQPGEFTEFRIVLPRTATLIAEPRGRA